VLCCDIVCYSVLDGLPLWVNGSDRLGSAMRGSVIGV
jgi:hypothetical protein